MKKADDIILIADYGRSGQGWLSYMLCFILNARYIEPYDLSNGKLYSASEHVISLTSGGLPGREATKYSLIVKTHNYPAVDVSLTNKVIYLMRDPRDVAVSAYYRYRNLRKQAGRRSIKAWIFDALTSYRFINLVMTYRRWRKHVGAWKTIDHYLVTYEDLSSDTENVLMGVLDYLGIDVDKALIKGAIEQFAFKTVTGREKGQEDLSNAEFRKGIVGDHKNQFSKLELRLFEMLFGQVQIPNSGK